MNLQVMEEKVQIGIDEEHRRDIAQGLGRILADTYTLYLKTQKYHWNVTGPHFQALHKMFEEHYQELAEANDTLAERIRALGFKAPGSYQEFAQLTEVRDNEGAETAREMVVSLIESHETVIRACRNAFGPAEDAGDQATADLLTERMEIHEKTAWMLRSLLEEGNKLV